MPSTKIIQPIPRRPVSLDLPQRSSSPPLTSHFSSNSPSRISSSLTLTSSTLLGIFSPASYDVEPETVSPTGTSAFHQSPSFFSMPLRRCGISRQTKKSRSYHLGLRILLLFGIGMSYGSLIQHLYQEPQLTPFLVKTLSQPKIKWIYLFLWGTSGVAFGSLLPFFETSSIDESAKRGYQLIGSDSKRDRISLFDQDWTPVIRSVGAFVGITYALRKVSWSSTFQASLALTIVNPVLWYLIDRSKLGLLLSSAVGTLGTALFLVSKPSMMSYSTYQVPLTQNVSLFHASTENKVLFLGFVDKENFEDAIWMLSVLFCSCVCFGNIGRRLALSPRK